MTPVPAPRPGRRQLQQFTTSSGRITALLRLPLIALMLMIGPLVEEPRLHTGAYLGVIVGFGCWASAVLAWSFTWPVPRWAAPLTTLVDLVALAALAALSGGGTSYVTPVFYLYPVFVVFHYRPVLTGVVGAVIAVAYLGVWLENLGRRGGPSLPGVVWLHFGLLSWLALASTVLTAVLTRRSVTMLGLLDAQQRVTAEAMAANQRHDAELAERLHDGALQDLFAVRRNLEQLQDPTDQTDPDLRRRLLAQSDTLLQETVAALRGTVSSLHPQVLAQLGLAPALRELADHTARRTGLEVRLELLPGPPPAWPTPTEDALMHSAARELLANIARHAQARHVWLELSREPRRLRLRVADDGIGFDPTAASRKIEQGHIGLASHTARLAAAGGHLELSRRHPTGTIAEVELPLDSPSAPHPSNRSSRGRRWLSSGRVSRLAGRFVPGRSGAVRL